MAAEVAKYHILFYGSPSGYQTNRAQIALFDSSGNPVAYVRFNDPGMFFEDDYEERDHSHAPAVGDVGERARCASERKPIYSISALAERSWRLHWSPLARRSSPPRRLRSVGSANVRRGLAGRRNV